MLSETARPATGVSRESLEAFIAANGEGGLPAPARHAALERFVTTPLRSPLRSGRRWKYDAAKFDFEGVRPAPSRARFEVDEEARSLGVIVTSLSEAVELHRPLLEARIASAADPDHDKFALLTHAFARGGAHVYVPEGVRLDVPIRIFYDDAHDESIFPYTLIVGGKHSEFTTIVEFARISEEQICCGITETILDENARLNLALVQKQPPEAMSFSFCGAKLGEGSSLSLGLTELGSKYTRTRLLANLEGPGSELNLTAFFFADGDQHVDLTTDVIHAGRETTSHTVVRSAGIEKGQGRYVGDIRIQKDAHGADASLRDDALLLSEESHVDSVPALEIAANDVKAYHGATVGSISEEELFYAQSRGIARNEAERMIALGFFEPALVRLPTADLRDSLRSALEAKLK